MTTATASTRNAARNARARARRAAAREELQRELAIVARLTVQLRDAGDDPYDLCDAVVFSSGGAVSSGMPEQPLCYVSHYGGGWVRTQYKSADFSCNAGLAACALAQNDDDIPLWGDILDRATVNQRGRAIHLALVGKS